VSKDGGDSKNEQAKKRGPVIWLDADACPRPIKEILFRASLRTQVPVRVVANSPMKIPLNPLTEFILVPRILDAADSRIVEECAAGDIVITADIPLAALVVEKGAFGINPRGEMYDASNISERLAIRNFLTDMRGSGERVGGPAVFDDKNKMQFANSLDRLLVKLKKAAGN
jgi:uncharacterized protein